MLATAAILLSVKGTKANEAPVLQLELRGR
jgi:hypothetical protein